MSSKNAPSSATAAASEPKLHPINLLDTPLAKAYNHIHPILVLTVLYASFSYLVADPVTTLVYLLIPLAVLQAAFCILCVPPSTDSRTTVSSQSSTPARSTQTQRRKKGSTWQSDVLAGLIPAILSTTLSLLVPTTPLFLLLILHGAPITTHIPHTILLATHLSLLSTPALFYAHGVSSTRWRTLVSLLAPVDEPLGAGMGTVVGAWVGAIPIPLDWDREWQRWPITVVVGAYGGWAVGRSLGGWGRVKGGVVRFED